MNDQIDQGNTQTTNPTNSSFPSMKRAAVKGKAKTKKQVAISLLRQAQGASRVELEKRLGWQPHSIRGFLSGTVRKLEDFELTAYKPDSGQWRYRLVARESA